MGSFHIWSKRSNIQTAHTNFKLEKFLQNFTSNGLVLPFKRIVIWFKNHLLKRFWVKSSPVLSIFRSKDWNMFVTSWETFKTAWLFSEQNSCKLLVFAFQGVHYHKASLLFYVTLTFICHWDQVSHTNNLILLPLSIY